MTISNEPGYYEEGQFGIRIESLCITIPANTHFNIDGKAFCRFETVTMVPIQTKLVQLSMLNDTELTLLNDYNQNVRLILLPLMETTFPEAVEYLIRETQPLLRA